MSTPDTPSDPPKQTLELAGGPVRYSDVGSGPVLVALHGSPGSGRDFRWVAPVLEPHCRVIRLDQSGHGDTPAHGTSHWTIQGRADLAAAFLGALDLRDVTLLGHSMGGAVALEVALRERERVTRVALVSSLGLRKHRLLRGKPVGLVSLALSIAPLRVLLMPTLRAGMRAAGFPSRTPDSEALASVHAISRVDFDRRAAVVRAVASAAIPSMVCWAEDDPIIEREVYEELSSALPPGPRLAFPDGFHNPQKTHAVEIGQALVEWIGGAPRCETSAGKV